MHELSVFQSILSQVETIAQQHQATAVTLIKLKIGPLSGVETPLLVNAWTIASANTIAAEAQFEVEEMPITIHCPSCDRESRAKANRMVCGHCGEWRTQLVSGDEMLLQSIELDKSTERENV